MAPTKVAGIILVGNYSVGKSSMFPFAFAVGLSWSKSYTLVPDAFRS